MRRILLALSMILATGVGTALGASPAMAAGGAPDLHVSGNHLVTSSGATIRLLGVDRSGTEFDCIHNNGIFDGPATDSSVAAIAAWHVNAVRVPLNEDCWLGLNGVNASVSGSAYQRAILSYVNLLHSHGMVAILDLHWTDGVYSANCSGYAANCQKPMPDSDHAPAFWSSVANAYKGDLSVVFDLFNEPFPNSLMSSTQAWSCWQNGGGSCPGIGFGVAGMQTLVTSVRGTGARNVIMLGGLTYSNDESQWLSHRPSDPTGNLAASWHSYNFNACVSTTCWNSQIAPLAAQVPVVAGELGENDCAHGYVDSVTAWMDSHGISYLGWTWNTWSCTGGPALITDYNGTPTTFGIGLRNHLATLAAGGGAGGGGGTSSGSTGRIQAPGGTCVDVTGASSTSGTAIELWSCNGGTAQAWTVAADGTLRARGKCMDITDDGTANLTRVQLWDCNGGANQIWRQQSNGSLVNPQSGRCLDSPGGATAPGTTLEIYTCSGGANQVFRLP